MKRPELLYLNNTNLASITQAKGKISDHSKFSVRLSGCTRDVERSKLHLKRPEEFICLELF